MNQGSTNNGNNIPQQNYSGNNYQGQFNQTPRGNQAPIPNQGVSPIQQNPQVPRVNQTPIPNQGVSPMQQNPPTTRFNRTPEPKSDFSSVQQNPQTTRFNQAPDFAPAPESKPMFSSVNSAPKAPVSAPTPEPNPGFSPRSVAPKAPVSAPIPEPTPGFSPVNPTPKAAGSAPIPEPFPVAKYDFAKEPDSAPIAKGSADIPSSKPAEKTLKNMSILLIAVLVLNIVTIVLMFFLGGSNEITAEEQLASQRNLTQYAREVGAECLSVSDMEINFTSSSYIRCNVKNKSDKDLTNVVLTVECFDSENNSLGTKNIYLGRLDAGKEIAVDEFCSLASASTVKLLYAEAYYYEDIEPQE